MGVFYAAVVASLEEFVAAGLYDPDDRATIGRLELLQWLGERGFTVEQMVAAMRVDGLGALAGDQRLVPGERLTRDEAIRLSGLDPVDFDAIATASGLVPIEGSPPGEIGFTRDEIDSLATFGAITSMFSADEAIGVIRVVGSSVARLADAMVSMFLMDVESRLLAEEAGELQVAISVYEAVGLLHGLAAQLDPLLRRQVLQAIERSRRATISRNERIRYRYAVGFVDLVGFTEMSGSMEPRQLGAFIGEFEGRAHDVATAAGARVVKLIGDEVMFVATDPAAACRAAFALMEGFAGEYGHVVPRGGLAYGEVLVRGGDYYGSVVNLASRLVDEAVPQEILVTQAVVDASAECRFDPAGRRMVKGFADPVVVHSFMAG